ncbi:MAG: signal recognition particle protein [Verrucomicrobiae bacterium]|nr:signal recognition particle protein [Verrucomicrobiae bacterium]
MLDQLSNQLQSLFKKLRGHGKLSEANVTDACRELRMALLEADVNFQVAKELIEKIKQRALGAEVLASVTPGQQMIKIFHDELVQFLGETQPLANGSPLKIMLCGLQGSGKTTTAGKLALWFKKQGKQPLLVAADLQRPAAITQLESLGKQLDLPVFSQHGATHTLAVVQEALASAATQLRNVVIIDTAGRLDLDEPLLEELQQLHHHIKPQETFFVADAALGQKSVEIVNRFKTRVPLSGIILTRLDSDARGGAAISIRHVTGLPLQFLGTGEKMDQLERLDANRLTSRILGMGDIVGLVEKAQETFDLENAAKLEEKLRKQTFDLHDFLSQLQQMKKLGPLENLLGMLPGIPKVPETGQAEKRLKRTEAILLSMTAQERAKPDLINAKRRQRIARGSGTTVTEVNELLLQFQSMKKLLKNKGRMRHLLSKLGVS